MKWLNQILGIKPKKPVVKIRSTKNSESLSNDEASFIVYGVKNNETACPDCEKGVLLQGPQGCGSVNCLCNNCFSEFSIYWVSENLIIGERISEPRGCNPGRLLSIYGIKLEV
jgi:hypothetical protein